MSVFKIDVNLKKKFYLSDKSNKFQLIISIVYEIKGKKIIQLAEKHSFNERMLWAKKEVENTINEIKKNNLTTTRKKNNGLRKN